MTDEELRGFGISREGSHGSIPAGKSVAEGARPSNKVPQLPSGVPRVLGLAEWEVLTVKMSTLLRFVRLIPPAILVCHPGQSIRR
jgi:hypothetical protein